MKDFYDTLTISQKKLLIDQEQWMKDVHESYTEDRTRLDAIHDIKKRFPTERIAREAIENNGDPAVVYLYAHGKIKKRYRSTKKIKRTTKCKCK